MRKRMVQLAGAVTETHHPAPRVWGSSGSPAASVHCCARCGELYPCAAAVLARVVHDQLR
jgi:hypothetical protein